MDKKEQLKQIFCKDRVYSNDSGGFVGVYTYNSFYSSYLDIWRSIEDVHFYEVGFIVDSDDNLLCKWDFENDDLDCQNSATIDFIYDLIINKKVIPNLIKDLEIIREFDAFRKKCSEWNKLCEQGICPECGGQLDECQGDKTCYNCGVF